MRRVRFGVFACLGFLALSACGQTTEEAAPPTDGDREPESESADPAELHFTALPETCVVGARCEIGGSLDLSPKNPFDPAELALDLELSAPSGTTTTRPGFYFQDFADNDGAPGAALGRPEWRSRFLPTESGQWRWRWNITLPTRNLHSAWRELMIGPAANDWHGLVRVSAKDARFLAFEDGTSYLPIGENIGWYDTDVREYRTWLDKLKAVQANYFRVWLASWGFAPEWTSPEGSTLGDYTARLDRLWALDRVFELAAERNLRLMLCLHYHGAYSSNTNSEWADNPLNAKNGGPLQKAADFFTNATAAELSKRRLRYLVARYGAEPALLAWELFNEVDLTDQHSPQVLAAWHRQMAAELRRLDPYPHLISTSTSQVASLYGIEKALYSLPEIDFAQVHEYGGPLGKEDFISRIPSLAASFAAYGKPVFFSELGVDSRGAAETLAADPLFIGLHDLLWVPLFAPSLGSGMTWWWDNVIEPENLYGQWAPLAEFVKGIAWDDEAFVTASFGAGHAVKPITVFALNGKTSSLLWIKNGENDYRNGGDNAPVEGATLDLSALPAGAYEALWLDPYGLRSYPPPSETVSNAQKAFAIPGFTGDIALRLTRRLSRK